MKAERGLLGIPEVVKRLRRAGVPRSPAAISGHVRAGWLRPERDFRKPQLFTEAAVDEYMEWLRDHDDDGRPGRPVHYDNDPRWRGQWYQDRHGTTPEFGRGAMQLAAPEAPPGRPSEVTAEQEARILELHEEGGKGASVRAIAQNVGVGRGKVERVLSRRRETVTKPPLAG